MTNIEKQIVEQVVADALAAGYRLTVRDREGTLLWRSRDAAVVLAAMDQADEEWLHLIDDDGNLAGWVQFIYGNDGPDVIADYSIRIAEIMANAEALADQLAKDTGA